VKQNAPLIWLRILYMPLAMKILKWNATKSFFYEEAYFYGSLFQFFHTIHKHITHKKMMIKFIDVMNVYIHIVYIHLASKWVGEIQRNKKKEL